MLTIISLLYSLLLFSTLLLCHHGPSTSCPAMIRPHGRLDSSSVCLCVCVLTWFPLCTCFSGDCVCLCVTLPCHNITGPTDALSSHKPFLSATLSLCPHTPPPHTHTNTQPPSSSTGPRQLPGLTVPEQRVLAGKISPPCLSLPHPVLPFPASFAGLSGSSCLQNNIHCQWEVGDIEGLLALVSRTLHIQPAAQLSANTQTEKKTL